MAEYKVVDADQLDADMKIVADAIREKGGTTAKLAFPLGMKYAVDALPEAGGGNGSGGWNIPTCTIEITTDVKMNIYEVIYSYVENGEIKTCHWDSVATGVPSVDQYTMNNVVCGTIFHAYGSGSGSPAADLSSNIGILYNNITGGDYVAPSENGSIGTIYMYEE